MKRMLLALAFLIAGCASLPAPETMSQRFAYAQGTITAMYNAAAQLTEAGVLGADDAIRIRDRLDEATDMIGTGQRLLAIGNLRESNDTLIRLNQLLIEINAQLNKRGANRNEQENHASAGTGDPTFGYCC